jgi:hypothetical protein
MAKSSGNLTLVSIYVFDKARALPISSDQTGINFDRAYHALSARVLRAGIATVGLPIFQNNSAQTVSIRTCCPASWHGRLRLPRVILHFGPTVVTPYNLSVE